MSTELHTLLNNQLGNTLTHFLNTKGETLIASGKATEMVFPTIIATILNHVNGNRSQAIDFYNKVMGKNELPYHNALSDLASGSSLDKIVELGKPLVQTLFGSKTDAVTTQIAEHSGVKVASASALLAAALPLVLSFLRTQPWNAMQFYEALSGQTTWLEKWLPAGLLGVLGIGSVSGLSTSVAGLAGSLGGIMGAAASSATGAVGVATGATAGGHWGKWLALLLLCGAGVFGLRTCMNGNTMATTAQSNGNSTPTSTISASQINAQADNNVNANNALTASTEMNANTANSAASNANASASNTSSDANTNAQSNQHHGDAAAASGSLNSNNGNANNANATTASDTAKVIASAETQAAADMNQMQNQPISTDNNTETTTPPANEDKVINENGVVKFYFATGFSRIAKEADEAAKEAIEAGKAGKKLIISGYTDSTGSAKRNAVLSRKRAQAVRAFFIHHGVKAANIELRKPENSVGAQGKNQEGRRVDVEIQ